MKALLLLFSLALISPNTYSAELKSEDCCPYGNNCSGKNNCIGSGWNKNTVKREFTSKKSKPKKSSGAGSTKQ
jgi:hypothetical protein